VDAAGQAGKVTLPAPGVAAPDATAGWSPAAAARQQDKPFHDGKKRSKNVGSRTALLRVASANLQYGGLTETLDDRPWHMSMEYLTTWHPDVVLLQEMQGRAPARMQAHLWRTANALGMTPVLGPLTPDSATGNCTAVLIRTTKGLDILDAGPPPLPPGNMSPAWCEVKVQVPGVQHPVWFTSVHLPARSAASQRLQAERLASLTASRGGFTVAGGDWNCYAPADPVSPGDMESLPPHLRPVRMIRLPGGGVEADYTVHQVLSAVGLIDVAAELPPECRETDLLTPTGVTGGPRVDRFYVTGSLKDALRRYGQVFTGGSDHAALCFDMDADAITATAPPPAYP
jgi:hypothetical protein